MVRVWSAQTERTVTDLTVGTRCGRVTALGTLLDYGEDEMIAVGEDGMGLYIKGFLGFRNGAVHIHDLRAADRKHPVLRNEEHTRPILDCSFDGTTCTASEESGSIFSLDLRMFSVCYFQMRLFLI